MPSEMARPAASSAARLMRRPDDSFSIDFDRPVAVAERLRCALNASTFVFTRRDIEILLDLVLGPNPAASCHRPCNGAPALAAGRRHIAFRPTSVSSGVVVT